MLLVLGRNNLLEEVMRIVLALVVLSWGLTGCNVPPTLSAVALQTLN